MTKNSIQLQALNALESNNFTGTCVMSTGSGKSKVAINAMERKDFRNILITVPRIGLKNSWKQELDKWKTPDCHIMITTIQTAYKWSKRIIQEYDLLIIDEIHTIGLEFYSIVEKAKELNIPIIGLTATPNKEDEFKENTLYKAIPIVFEYYDSEEDGVTNKCRYIIYEHELSDEHKVIAGTKNKQWLVGEKTQYEYLDSTLKECEKVIKENYFKLLTKRVNERIERNNKLSTGILTIEEIIFIQDIVSKDLEYYYNCLKPRYENKDLSLPLYYALKDIRGVNYSILGTNVLRYLSMGIPSEIKPIIAKYNWAMNNRKELLCSLNSTAEITNNLKKVILKGNNKILLFSELTSQSNKLSPYVIHSNVGKTTKETNILNKATLEEFNKGEIKEIASCQSLTLGLNLKEANWAIFESYYGSKVSSMQRKGRMNRLGVKDIANIIIIKVKNTQQEVWFDKAFSFIKDYETITSVEQLKL